MADQDGLSICAQRRKRRESILPYWRPLYDAKRKEESFLDGVRFAHHNDVYNLDRRFQQFRGPETGDANRHMIAVATMSPITIEARPESVTATSDDCEMAVRVMEGELEAPDIDFATTRYEVISDAINSRAGAAFLHYDAQLNRAYARSLDVCDLMFEPGFVDPHHIACSWMEIAIRMPVVKVKANGKLKGKAKWSGTENIVSDGQYRRQEAGIASGSNLGSDNYGNLLGVPGDPTDDEHVWVIYSWDKYDPAAMASAQEDKAIPPADRYIACDNPECDYREPTAQEYVDAGVMDSVDELPPYRDETCPECGAPMSRRDYEPLGNDIYQVPPGRQLIIYPLFQRTPDDEPFWQGDWPVQDCRGFPLYYVSRYVRARRPMGDSDTTRMWDQQQANDQMMTKAFNDMMKRQSIAILPTDRLYNHEGLRYEMRDDDEDVAFADISDLQGPEPMIRFAQNSALDPSWPSYMNVVREMLTQFRGIADFGLTPESTKDIPVGTAQTIEHQGNIPITDFMKRENRSLEKFLNVYYDYKCALDARGKLSLVRQQDEDLVVNVNMKAMPRVRFNVSAVKDFKGVDEARQRSAQQLYGILQQDPNPEAALDFYAVAFANDWSPQVIRAARKYLADRKNEAEQAAAQQGGGMPQDMGLEDLGSEMDQQAGGVPAPGAPQAA